MAITIERSRLQTSFTQPVISLESQVQIWESLIQEERSKNKNNWTFPRAINFVL